MGLSLSQSLWKELILVKASINHSAVMAILSRGQTGEDCMWGGGGWVPSTSPYFGRMGASCNTLQVFVRHVCSNGLQSTAWQFHSLTERLAYNFGKFVLLPGEGHSTRAAWPWRGGNYLNWLHAPSAPLKNLLFRIKRPLWEGCWVRRGRWRALRAAMPPPPPGFSGGRGRAGAKDAASWRLPCFAVSDRPFDSLDGVCSSCIGRFAASVEGHAGPV